MFAWGEALDFCLDAGPFAGDLGELNDARDT